MSFLDDIADTVKDVASTVGDGVSHVAKEALSTALAPADAFFMKGLGAATSVVDDVFGGVEFFDQSFKGMKIAEKSIIAAPLSGVDLLAKELGIGKSSDAGSESKQQQAQDKQKEMQQHKQMEEMKLAQMKEEMKHNQERNGNFGLFNPEPHTSAPERMHRSQMQETERAYERKHSEVALNPQPLPPHPDERFRGWNQTEPLNPQPLPPHPDERFRGWNQTEPLNPQPLPPHPDERFRGWNQTEPLNPQPLPPHPDEVHQERVKLMDANIDLIKKHEELRLNPQVRNFKPQILKAAALNRVKS